MGLVRPDRVLTKGGAQPGDVLLLTKPLGVGIITTALKGDAADPVHVSAAVASMKALNRRAASFSQQAGAHACTDITGFSLLGHGYEMAERSGARLRFHLDRLPFLDGATCYAEQELFPGGSCRNRDAYSQWVDFPTSLSEAMRLLLFTPETSGGLLIALPPQRAETMIRQCREGGQDVWAVGEVLEGQGIEVL